MGGKGGVPVLNEGSEVKGSKKKYLVKERHKPYMDSITVKSPLWGGYKLFNWDKREPFVGLSENKLNHASDVVEINLEYLRAVFKKNRTELIELAEKNNWRGNNGRLPCYYFPESVIRG